MRHAAKTARDQALRVGREVIAGADAYLVPNGVAEITVQYGSRNQTINAKVVNNVATWHSDTTEPQRIT